MKLLECSQALKAAAPIARDAPRGDGPTTPSEGPDVLHTLRKNGALAYSNGAPVALFSALNSEVDVLSRKQQRHFGCVRHISLCLDWRRTVELETEHRSHPLSAPLRVDVRNRGVGGEARNCTRAIMSFVIRTRPLLTAISDCPRTSASPGRILLKRPILCVNPFILATARAGPGPKPAGCGNGSARAKVHSDRI